MTQSGNGPLWLEVSAAGPRPVEDRPFNRLLAALCYSETSWTTYGSCSKVMYFSNGHLDMIFQFSEINAIKVSDSTDKGRHNVAH